MAIDMVEVFRHYAPQNGMDIRAFIKSLKDGNLLDEHFTKVDADLAFARRTAKGSRRISHEEYLQILRGIARRRSVSDEDIFRLAKNGLPDADEPAGGEGRGRFEFGCIYVSSQLSGFQDEVVVICVIGGLTLAAAGFAFAALSVCENNLRSIGRLLASALPAIRRPTYKQIEWLAIVAYAAYSEFGDANMTNDKTVDWGNLPVFVYCSPSHTTPVVNAKVALSKHIEAHWEDWQDPDIKIRLMNLTNKGEDRKSCAVFDTADVVPSHRSRVFLAIEASPASSMSRAGLYYLPDRNEYAEPVWLMWIQGQRSTDLELAKSFTGWKGVIDQGLEADYRALGKGQFDDLSEPQTVPWHKANTNNQSTKFFAYVHILEKYATARLRPTFLARVKAFIQQVAGLYVGFWFLRMIFDFNANANILRKADANSKLYQVPENQAQQRPLAHFYSSSFRNGNSFD
ncbi:unnamed protein product [Symbiodinium sp. CCMP2592]|nr:unnamed protein product [Symbiodinium sp. CCMP2592]